MSVPRKQIRLVLPVPLYEQVKRLSAGNQTRFILAAIQERVGRQEQEELERALAEGYQARNAERLQWAEQVAPLVADL